MKTGMLAIALAAFTLTTPALAVEKVKLTMSSSHNTIVPWVTALKSHVIANSNKRLEAMGSKYRIEWTEAFGGVLYNFKDTLEAVQQGISDMGWVGALWEPAKMPMQNLMYAVPFSTSDVEVAVEIMNELNDTIPAMMNEWTKHNLKFLGATVSDTYHLFTKFPVKKLSDLKGRKLVGATALGPWLKGTGAVFVTGGLPTFYTQLQTGVAEGTVIIPNGAFSFKLHEVAKQITLVDLGSPTIGGFAVNMDTWKRLPADVQKVLGKLGREYSSVHARDVKTGYKKSLDKMAKAGATITTLPAAERQKWVDLLPNLAKDWVKANEAKGLPAREAIKKFMAAARKRGEKPLRDWDKGL
ncbi:MAG: C4-dicarboxylate TRAP transporter substrate-binding protein [Rhodospirillales bacterium]|nr:C4-dicarboxylate TRAP transporter substrate-binding protein [Rhodospirillales bacterium]